MAKVKEAVLTEQTLQVTIRVLEDLWGTVPADKEVFETYIQSKKPKGEEDESETLPDVEKKGTTGFHRDENGLFLYNYVIRGFLKHAANVLKDQLSVKAMRSKLTNYVFVYPRKIYLDRPEADGIVERPLRAQTMQGPRVSLARSEYVSAGATLSFEVVILAGEITRAHIEELLKYGRHQGLGQNRGAGYGSFEVVEIK